MSDAVYDCQFTHYLFNCMENIVFMAQNDDKWICFTIFIKIFIKFMFYVISFEICIFVNMAR